MRDKRYHKPSNIIFYVLFQGKILHSFGVSLDNTITIKYNIT